MSGYWGWATSAARWQRRRTVTSWSTASHPDAAGCVEWGGPASPQT